MTSLVRNLVATLSVATRISGIDKKDVRVESADGFAVVAKNVFAPPKRRVANAELLAVLTAKNAVKAVENASKTAATNAVKV